MGRWDQREIQDRRREMRGRRGGEGGEMTVCEMSKFVFCIFERVVICWYACQTLAKGRKEGRKEGGRERVKRGNSREAKEEERGRDVGRRDERPLGGCISWEDQFQWQEHRSADRISSHWSDKGSPNSYGLNYSDTEQITREETQDRKEWESGRWERGKRKERREERKERGENRCIKTFFLVFAMERALSVVMTLIPLPQLEATG
jgi:hypothetical protein